MSFAPSKTKRKSSPDSPNRTQDKRSQMLESPSYSFPMRSTANLTPDVASRLEVIESNLSRVSNQQDALLPLMNMVDVTQNLAKNETLMKNLHKKCAETDERTAKMEQLFKSYQSNIDATLTKIASQQNKPTFDSALFEKNIKGIVTQVNDQGTALKELDNNFSSYQKTMDARLKDEFGNNAKLLDNRLDKNKQDFTGSLNELKASTVNALKRLDESNRDLSAKCEKMTEFIQANSKQKLMEEMQDLISHKLQEHFEFLREKYDKDIDNLYREVGILRSEMDLINDEKRQQKMNPYLQALPKDVEPGEKKIKINNIEQALNVHELDKFNKDNTQRIMYELQAFDDKLDNLRNQVVALKAKNKSSDKASSSLNTEELNKMKDDMDLVFERYINLKYQIEGAKKKYLFDMRKIEDKMEKILQIKKEAAEEMISNPKTKRLIPQEMIVIEGFPDKIKNLMESINKNLETTFTRLEIVEEKIKENQDLIKK